MLTKSNYLTYLQCPKAFWLSEQQPHLATPPAPAVQRRIQMGQAVEDLARQKFPEGTAIPHQPDPPAMAAITAEAIAHGAETLFQGTLAAADLMVRTDILIRTAPGWHLLEVKSTTSVKEDEHLPDIAFQLYVLQQAGLPVTQASLLHLNRDCRYPELADLFTRADLTDQAQAQLPTIETDIAEMRRIQPRPVPPAIALGRQCTQPRTCAFFDHCWQGVEGLTIFDIAGLGQQTAQQLQEAGILHLADLPPDFPLPAPQREFATFLLEEEINIDRAAIQGALDALVYPLYFFDFETIDYAVPAFPGCRPYDQVPFQYSCHVLHEAGTVDHREYLHTDTADPRRALVTALLGDIGSTGHLIVYYAPFERRILTELAEALPEYREPLTALADRLWDQYDIFRRFYRHHGFGRSNSLKSVLPVVVPELSYDSLAVQDGSQVQVIWEQMIATANAAEKERLAEQLRAYCRLDTWGMVKMHQVLAEL